jgi:hypothetical protein
MKFAKILVLATISLIIIFSLMFIPFKRIYIKESKPIQFYKNEKPIGLIEAYNNYVVYSYGSLLKQNKEEFFNQFMKFNSSEYASSYFSNVIQIYKQNNIEVNLTSFNNIQKAIIISKQGFRENYSIAILKENKIFYVAGDKNKIEEVAEWLNRKF